MTRATQHIVITRFNVRFSSDPSVKSLGIDERWLEDRFLLFEKYCVSSINAQSNQEFSWVLLFDEDTPERFLDRAEGLISNRKGSRIFKGTSFPLSDLLSRLESIISDQCQWIITTRLDNDDALHRDFVENIQQAAKPDRPEVINFPRGIIVRGEKAYDRRDDSNAFISLSESRAGFQTVLSIRNHKYARESFHLRQLNFPSMWLQIVHDTNISNRVRGLRIPMKTAQADFPMLAEKGFAVRTNEQIGIALENLVLFPLRSFRDLAAVTVRRAGKMFGLEIQRRARAIKTPSP